MKAAAWLGACYPRPHCELCKTWLRFARGPWKNVADVFVLVTVSKPADLNVN